MSLLLLTLVHMEELRTIEKQSLQPDREGNDSAGAEQRSIGYYTVFGAAEGSAAPGAPRQAGPAARPVRGWAGRCRSPAKLSPALRLLLRSAASPCFSHTSPDLGFPPGPGLVFSRNHTLQC